MSIDLDWRCASIGAVFFLTVGMLGVKFAEQKGVDVERFTGYMWLVATTGMWCYLVSRHIFYGAPLTIPATLSPLVIISGIGFMFGALLLNVGIYRAPNPGFATAIGSAQVLLVTVFSRYLFGSSFSPMKVTGAALVVLGVVLLAVGGTDEQ